VFFDSLIAVLLTADLPQPVIVAYLVVGRPTIGIVEPFLKVRERHPHPVLAAEGYEEDQGGHDPGDERRVDESLLPDQHLQSFLSFYGLAATGRSSFITSHLILLFA